MIAPAPRARTALLVWTAATADPRWAQVELISVAVAWVLGLKLEPLALVKHRYRTDQRRLAIVKEMIRALGNELVIAWCVDSVALWSRTAIKLAIGVLFADSIDCCTVAKGDISKREAVVLLGIEWTAAPITGRRTLGTGTDNPH